MATIQTESQALAPSPVVEMFYIDFSSRLDTTSSGIQAGPLEMYVTNETQVITFGGQVYRNIALQFTPPDPSMLDNNIPRGQMVIFGQDEDIKDAINIYKKLKGSKITYITTHSKFLDSGSEPDTTQKIEEVYFIEGIKERTKEKIVFDIVVGVGLDKLTDPALRRVVIQ